MKPSHRQYAAACAAAWVVAAVVGAAGCAGMAGDPGSAAGAGSRERLEAHVRFLASDALEGRMTGTAGYAVAAEYVASQLRQLGLEPAGTDGFLQPVSYDSAVGDGATSRAWIHRRGGKRALTWKEHWVPGRRTVAERAQFRAPAVFVGYGVHAPALGHDDYAGLDVRGKIVVLLLGAPKTFASNPRAYYSTTEVKLEAAAAHGAAGLVLIRDAYFAGQYAWDKFVINVGKVPNMRWVPPAGGRAPAVPDLRVEAMLSETAAAMLFERAPQTHEQILAADRAGQPVPRFDLGAELEFDARSKPVRSSAANVVGMLRGSDPVLAREIVVYTAHLDHLGVGNPVNGDSIYNGMYDNAMGVAILLETARAFTQLQRAPRRSILFLVVGGEERGLLGSEYFANHPTVPAGALVADVNLDMPLFLFPTAGFVAFGAEHSTLGAMAEAAAAAEGLKLVPDPMPEEVTFIRSDHYSLVRQGVPALYLWPHNHSSDPFINGPEVVRAFRQRHYHQPGDDLRQPVDWPSAEKFARVNFRIGLEVAQADEPPRWHPGNFFGELFGVRAKPAAR